MLFVNLIISGGILYAGAKVYHRRRANRKKAWLVKQNRPLIEETPQPTTEQTNPLSHYFAMSTISLGLSTSGALFYPPLGVASIPFNVYTTIPMLSNSIYSLLEKRQLKAGLVASVGVLVAIIKQDYLLASTLDWGYYAIITLKRELILVSRNVIAAFEQSYRQILYEFLNTPPQSVWVLVNEVELKIPYETLDVGDILVVDSIGVIPIQGVVVDGMATIDRYIATGDKNTSMVQQGDTVYPTTIVLSGRVYIQVCHI